MRWNHFQTNVILKERKDWEVEDKCDYRYDFFFSTAHHYHENVTNQEGKKLLFLHEDIFRDSVVYGAYDT